MSTLQLVDLPFEVIVNIWSRVEPFGFSVERQRSVALISRFFLQIARALKRVRAPEEEDIEKGLFVAIVANNFELVSRLIDSGVSNVNVCTTKGISALAFATQKARMDIVGFLLDRGAAVDQQDDTGNTALHLAAARGDVDCAAVLIQGGAALDVQAMKGRTPLHHAAANGHVSIVLFLCGHGASLDVRNSRGKTPLELAIEKKKKEVVSALTGVLDHREKGGGASGDGKA